MAQGQMILPAGPYNPSTRAAQGPNWSEGVPFFQWWKPNNVESGSVKVIPANYGQEGGMPRYDWEKFNIIGNPLEPARLTHKPVWNALIPSINWHLQVLTKQQLQTFENATNVTPPQLPMQFQTPATASLLK